MRNFRDPVSGTSRPGLAAAVMVVLCAVLAGGCEEFRCRSETRVLEIPRGTFEKADIQSYVFWGPEGVRRSAFDAASIPGPARRAVAVELSGEEKMALPSPIVFGVDLAATGEGERISAVPTTGDRLRHRAWLSWSGSWAAKVTAETARILAERHPSSQMHVDAAAKRRELQDVFGGQAPPEEAGISVLDLAFRRRLRTIRAQRPMRPEFALPGGTALTSEVVFERDDCRSGASGPGVAVVDVGTEEGAQKFRALASRFGLDPAVPVKWIPGSLNRESAP